MTTGNMTARDRARRHLRYLSMVFVFLAVLHSLPVPAPAETVGTLSDDLRPSSTTPRSKRPTLGSSSTPWQRDGGS